MGSIELALSDGSRFTIQADDNGEAGARAVALNALEQPGLTLSWICVSPSDESAGERRHKQGVGASATATNTEELAQVLLKLAHDGTQHWIVCELAVEVLRRLGRTDDLLRLARDGSVWPPVRMRSAAAAGDLGYPDEAARVLASLVQELCGWNEVRVEAAEVLTRLGQPEATAQAWLTLASNLWLPAHLRERAARTLQRLGFEDQAAQAWLTLARDQIFSIDLQVRAIRRLSKMRRVHELRELATDDALLFTERAQAAEALARLGHMSEAAQALAALARDEHKVIELRRTAVAQLRKLGRVDELHAIARDRQVSPWVRLHVARALGT